MRSISSASPEGNADVDPTEKIGRKDATCHTLFKSGTL